MRLYLMFITAVCVLFFIKPWNTFFHSSLRGLQFLEYTQGTSLPQNDAQSARFDFTAGPGLCFTSSWQTSYQRYVPKTKRIIGGGTGTYSPVPKRMLITRLFPRNNWRCSPQITFVKFPFSQKFCFTSPWSLKILLNALHNSHLTEVENAGCYSFISSFMKKRGGFMI